MIFDMRAPVASAEPNKTKATPESLALPNFPVARCQEALYASLMTGSIKDLEDHTDITFALFARLDYQLAAFVGHVHVIEADIEQVGLLLTVDYAIGQRFRSCR